MNAVAKIEAPSLVRLAQPDEADQIMDLCRMLHSENGLLSMSEAKVRAMLDRAWNRQGAIVGVIGDRGEPVASIYLGISQPIYSDDWWLNEEFAYVAPEYRRHGYAGQLIAYAKECADRLRLPLLTGILSNHRTEAKVRLYERQLNKVGASFAYGLEYATGHWGTA